MAVEMGRPTLPNIPGWLTEMNAEERVISILTHIAKSDGFQKWERDVSQWVTTKAYDDIQHHNECVLVLMRLLDGSADLSELKEHVRAENGDVERVEDAVQRLLSHQILIRRRKDGRYEAAEQAKSHILPVLDDPSPKEATPTKIADSIEQLLDQTRFNRKGQQCRCYWAYQSSARDGHFLGKPEGFDEAILHLDDSHSSPYYCRNGAPKTDGTFFRKGSRSLTRVPRLTKSATQYFRTPLPGPCNITSRSLDISHVDSKPKHKRYPINASSHTNALCPIHTPRHPGDPRYLPVIFG